MNTIEEIRRLRLAELKKEFGSYVALNSRLGLTARDSTLSQCGNASSNSKSGKPRSMGSELARALERATGKEIGWMDNCGPISGPDQSRFETLSAEDQAYVLVSLRRAIDECEQRQYRIQSGSPLSTSHSGEPAPTVHDERKRHVA